MVQIDCIKAWLPDISQARLSLDINLELDKYVRIPRYVFNIQTEV